MQSTNNPPPRAPWRNLFEKHLAEMPAPEFTLGTAFQDKGKTFPHVRTCIFRSFWGELKLRDSAREELQKQSQATSEAGDEAASKDFEPNPPLYESDMLSFTTDVRMDKVEQIMSCYGDNHDGGGEVECMFWIKPLSTQWRLKGRAYIVGSNKEDVGENNRRDIIFRWMRPRPQQAVSPVGDATKSWSWEKEITAHFANMSPIMRGGFPFLRPSLLYIVSNNNADYDHAPPDLNRIACSFLQTISIANCPSFVPIPHWIFFCYRTTKTQPNTNGLLEQKGRSRTLRREHLDTPYRQTLP